MSTISFEDWEKLELQVAEITNVEEHPNADKLIVITVDLGTETRTLVAGLKGHYDPDDLLGKKVIVFTNLEPTELRGVKSEGMILAAQYAREHLPQHLVPRTARLPPFQPQAGDFANEQLARSAPPLWPFA